MRADTAIGNITRPFQSIWAKHGGISKSANKACSRDAGSIASNPLADPGSGNADKGIFMQTADTAPGPYYVSVMRDGGDFRPLSGPYQTHAEALAAQRKATNIAQDLDCKAIWYSFGTIRMRDDYCAPGLLQRMGYSLHTLEKHTIDLAA